MPARFANMGATKHTVDEILRYETGQFQWAVPALVDFCKAYGTTPDAVLHFTAPQNRCAPLPWLQKLFLDYSPKEGELYLVVTSDPSVPQFCDARPARWKNGCFVNAAGGKKQVKNLICFIPLSELPTGFTFSLEDIDNG
jgi:hypothetical protein